MAASMDEARQLIKRKDEIEQEIKALTQVLESQGGVGMRGSLVDEDQFPRADIDVYTVRHARHTIICLQNDHKAVMKQIEQKLHDVHAQARLDPAPPTPMDIDLPLTPRQPFAKVTLVDRGSPADNAGVQVGDEILQFGSVSVDNFESMQTIATVVQHSKAVPLVVRLVREGRGEVRVSLTPNTWSGRGLLGCNIVPLKK